MEAGEEPGKPALSDAGHGDEQEDELEPLHRSCVRIIGVYFQKMQGVCIVRTAKSPPMPYTCAGSVSAEKENGNHIGSLSHMVSV